MPGWQHRPDDESDFLFGDGGVTRHPDAVGGDWESRLGAADSDYFGTMGAGHSIGNLGRGLRRGLGPVTTDLDSRIRGPVTTDLDSPIRGPVTTDLDSPIRGPVTTDLGTVDENSYRDLR